MSAKSIFGNRFTLLVLVLVLAAGVYSYWQGSHEGVDETRYRLVKVVKGNVTQTVSANGTLNPVVLVNVGTQVSGTVKRLHVDFNDKVRKGQVLMELDAALFEAQVRQSEANVRSAEASLELAQANEARMRDLFAQEYVSRQEYDQAVQALKSARSQLDLSRAQLQKDKTNLGYTVIRSPVSGVVIAREVDVGQTVAASFQTPTLFKIAQDLGKMQINSSFAEADVGNIRVGQPVQFTVDAFSGKIFPGVVKQVRLNPTTQQNVVTYDVVVSVDNPDHILLPGMTAYVNIAVASRKDVLLVPNEALRFRPKENGTGKPPGRKTEKDGFSGRVYVLEQGKPKQVMIRTGITDNRMTELVAGALREGDSLVAEDTMDTGTAAGNQQGGPRVRMF